jgi:hypothetical protein
MALTIDRKEAIFPSAFDPSRQTIISQDDPNSRVKIELDEIMDSCVVHAHETAPNGERTSHRSNIRLTVVKKGCPNSCKVPSQFESISFDATMDTCTCETERRKTISPERKTIN